MLNWRSFKSLVAFALGPRLSKGWLQLREVQVKGMAVE